MYSFTKRHRRSEEDRRDCMIVGFTSINAYVSSNPVNGEVYLIQHCVINFVSDLWQACRWFSPGTPTSTTDKTDCHDRAEILLKVALITITPTHKRLLIAQFSTDTFVLRTFSNLLTNVPLQKLK
jgi:hypothetical protein